MNDTVKEFDAKMQKTIDVYVSEYASVRAGRANAPFSIDYRGLLRHRHAAQQVSTIPPPILEPCDSAMDASLLKAIEKRSRALI
jgi:ribosome recycling factor